MLHSAVEQKPFWSNALKLLLFDAQWSKAELSINREKVAELSINREKVAELPNGTSIEKSIPNDYDSDYYCCVINKLI